MTEPSHKLKSRPKYVGSAIFNLLFALITLVFAPICLIVSFLPGHRIFMRTVQAYTRTMVAAFEEFCDVDVVVRGSEQLPEGACIIAAKHQSYGDGLIMFSNVENISFIADNHIEKFWIIRRILAKIGAVMVDNCGGPEQRERMNEIAARVKEQGRKILIYPEGHLSQVGTHHRYRKGIFHLYQDFDCPVVPVATNLGQRWNQNEWVKHSGQAVVEFLEPILPGMDDKDAFMALLQDRIETRSIALLDLDNPGKLNPEDIGQLRENKVARAKRETREAEAATLAMTR